MRNRVFFYLHIFSINDEDNIRYRLYNDYIIYIIRDHNIKIVDGDRFYMYD